MTEPHEQAYAALNKVVTYWEDHEDDKFKSYAAPYKDPAIFENLYNFYASLMDFLNVDEDSVGCDLGCWLGFPVYLESVSTNSWVHGIEIQQSFTDTARQWTGMVDAPKISFDAFDDGKVPLADHSLDWVLINQVLCNALQSSFDNTVTEACRLIKPGGTLVIADSNAPDNPDVVERLIRTYTNAEIGPKGTDQIPAGHNHVRRRNLIRSYAPDLDPEVLQDLARRTSYMWEPQLQQVVVDYQATGELPESYFAANLDRTPCNPINGGALGNPTDPFLIADIVRSNGMHPIITQGMHRQETDESTLREGLRSSGSFFVIADRPL